MNDIEAFLLLLSYLLPFGGLMHIFWGTDTDDNSKITFGLVCMAVSLFIMIDLLYNAKKDKALLKYNARRIKLLVGMFRHILASCILMIAEYLILYYFGFQFRYNIAIICISLIISTIISNFRKKT